MTKLTEQEIDSLLEEKVMKTPKKGKWYYRCKQCSKVYNNKDHGKYVLIDVFSLIYQNSALYLPDVHEGILFCSKKCAKEKIHMHMD